MISGSVTLRHYRGWKVVYFVAADSEDTDDILDVLERVGCSHDRLRRVEKMLMRKSCDTGFTFTNKNDRISVITCSKTTNIFELINTFAHEVDHVEKHIAKALEFDPYSERASYLVGELVRDIFIDLTEKLFCK